MNSPFLKLTFAAVAGLATAGVSTASAGYADAHDHVKAPRWGEASVSQIMGEMFGGEFTKSSAGWSNGNVNATRVDERAGLDCAGLSSLTVSAVARYAGNSQTIGYMDNGTRRDLFDVTGFGMDVDETPVATLGGDVLCDVGGTLVLTRSGGEGGTHSMVPEDNADNRDHALTYRIERPGDDAAAGGQTWVMFWEDLTRPLRRGRTDDDYNDVVLLLSGSGASLSGDVTASAPLPAGAWAGLGMLGALGVAKLRKRRA